MAQCCWWRQESTPRAAGPLTTAKRLTATAATLASLHSRIVVTSFSCGEMPDRALDPIIRAIGPNRLNPVVIGCLGLEIVDAHAKDGVGMPRVQPDWRFRRLAQVAGIGTIVHDAVMLGRAPGVIAFPPDNCQMVVSRFELWALLDLDAHGFLSSRTHLSGQ